MRFLVSLLSRRVLCVLAAAAGVLPFLVLAFYSHPALDDFAIGTYLRNFTMGQYLAEVYSQRSGRYAAIGCSVVLKYFGTHPQTYQVLIVAGFIAFILSIYLVAASMAARARAGGGLALSLGGFLTIMALVCFPWPAEGIFWLTGSIAYLYPMTLLALLLALLIRLYALPTRVHRLRWAVAMVLAFFIPGFSEITALLLPLVYIGTMLALRVPAWRWPWGGVGAALLLGSLLTMAAPAHFAQWYTLGRGQGLSYLLKVVALATGGTAYCVLNWLGDGVLMLLVLLGLPLAMVLARADTQLSLVHRLTRQRWLWPILTLSGIWLSFLFCHVASGIAPALRVKNILYLYFVAGGLLSAYSWASNLDARYLSLLLARPVQLGLTGWLLLAFFSDHNVSLTHNHIGEGSNTIMQAYRDWLSGDAARYDQQQRARLAQVRASAHGSEPLRLDPLRATPRTIFYHDISANEKLWGNACYTQFYSGPPVYVLEKGVPR